MNLPSWAPSLVLAGAAVTALYIILNKVVQPGYRGIKILEEAVPVLVQVAHDFSTNGGSSLKGSIDKLTDATISASTKADAAVVAAGKAADAAATAATVAAEASKELRTFIEYNHESNHNITSTLAVIRGFVKLLEKNQGDMLQELEKIPKDAERDPDAKDRELDKEEV